MSAISKPFWVLIVASIVALAGERTRLRHTCVICRLVRVDTTEGEVVRSKYVETACSRWYRSHVEDQHAHIWERDCCIAIIGKGGKASGWACRPGHYPIWSLSSDTQMRVYQHFKDPWVAKALFAGPTDKKTHDDRLDEEGQDKGHLIVTAMEEWEAAGFPGTWEGWWTRFYERHVAERKLWLEWLGSDSKMNFWDWQERRKPPGIAP